MHARRVGIALIAALLVPAAAAAQTKKYAVRSGIVELEEVASVGAMQLKHRIVVSFDDWGAKERRDKYREGRLEESSFSDGTTLYTLKPAAKKAFVIGRSGRGTELKVDWAEISDADKKQGKARQLPSMEVAGRTCETIAYDQGRNKTVMAGSGGVLLYYELTGSGMKTVTKAVKYQENAAVPPSTFVVPADFVVEKR
jgi:hypothetical protein